MQGVNPESDPALIVRPPPCPVLENLCLPCFCTLTTFDPSVPAKHRVTCPLQPDWERGSQPCAAHQTLGLGLPQNPLNSGLPTTLVSPESSQGQLLSPKPRPSITPQPLLTP